MDKKTNKQRRSGELTDVSLHSEPGLKDPTCQTLFTDGDDLFRRVTTGLFRHLAQDQVVT